MKTLLIFRELVAKSLSRISSTLPILALFLSVSFGAFAQEGRALTQAETAQILVRRLHLHRVDGKALTGKEAIAVLSQRDIAPFDGWQPDAVLSRNDLAKILVEALDLEGDVLPENRGDKSKPAYVIVLYENTGINMARQSVQSALDRVGMARRRVDENRLRAVSSDPALNPTRSDSGGEEPW